MSSLSRRLIVLALVGVVLAPGTAQAAGVAPAFDLSSPSGAPFPTDRYTLPDPTQLTGLRVDLPKPNCAVRPSDCLDIDVLNTLDGFNLQPRLSIPFTGAIDVASVSSANVFLVRLSDGAVTGINQIAWEPSVNTLHAESDQLLDQHARYLLVVTNGVEDAAGDPIETSSLLQDLNYGHAKDAAAKAYRKELIAALNHSLPTGVGREEVATASIFTTQSATTLLEQVRGQIKASTPAPADFVIGDGGERTVFARSDVTGITFRRQVTTLPFLVDFPFATAALSLFPNSVDTLAFGSYVSPDYENASRFIPAVGSATGVPVVQGTNRIYFNLFLPAGTKPSGGWPVAIFGHGFGDNKNSSPTVVASSMARRGIATIAINVVGHGGGPLGKLIVNRAAGPVTLSAGGREIDQDGNGQFSGVEGVNAAAAQNLIGSRDGLRQTVIDLMQLVREIEVGMDVDGDGTSDLNPDRISYFGQSFGGIYGTKFLAIEPHVQAGVPNVAGGAIIEVARLGGFRGLVVAGLAARTPALTLLLGTFNENIPLRNLPPVVLDTTAGPIQTVIENTEWASQSGNPVAYAPHLRAAPLAGVPAKSIILQFARGDQTVPNPTTSAIIRAGALQDRTTLFRNDLAFAADPTFPKNPHTFLTRIPGLTGSAGAAAAAVAGQDQIAQFFASGGTLVIDPDGAGPLFETPMVGPPPEDLAYIP